MWAKPTAAAQAVEPILGCDIVKTYTDWDIAVIQALCEAESGGNTLATGHNNNGSTDFGLLQINSIHSDMVGGDLNSLYSPEVNVRVAHKIWAGRGFHAWSTYSNKVYLNYL